MKISLLTITTTCLIMYVIRAVKVWLINRKAYKELNVLLIKAKFGKKENKYDVAYKTFVISNKSRMYKKNKKLIKKILNIVL